MRKSKVTADLIAAGDLAPGEGTRAACADGKRRSDGFARPAASVSGSRHGRSERILCAANT